MHDMSIWHEHLFMLMKSTFLCLPGLLSSNYGLETIAFLSTKSELQKQGWPNLQIHFAGFIPNRKFHEAFRFNEQVSSGTSYLIAWFCALLLIGWFWGQVG